MGNSEHHRFLTGRDNPQIKQSIRWLAAQNKRLTELRLLVIPGQCDYLGTSEAADGVYPRAGKRAGAPQRVSCARRLR